MVNSRAAKTNPVIITVNLIEQYAHVDVSCAFHYFRFSCRRLLQQSMDHPYKLSLGKTLTQ